MMEYRGYRAELSFDDDAGVLHGEVVEHARPDHLFRARRSRNYDAPSSDSVNEYLKTCAERGWTSDKPISGKISLRVAPEVDRAAVGSVC